MSNKLLGGWLKCPYCAEQRLVEITHLNGEHITIKCQTCESKHRAYHPTFEGVSKLNNS